MEPLLSLSKAHKTTKILLLCINLLLMASSSSASTHSSNSSGPVTPTDPLVAFLVKIQETAASLHGNASSNFDPKEYVDLPLKRDFAEAEAAFRKLNVLSDGSVSKSDFDKFVAEYFGSAGSDVLYHEPVDFVAEPQGFLPMVKDGVVRKWALEVHGLWRNLSRKVASEVKSVPGRHTLLPIPEPAIIPGSRFREVYYWDSYWVIRGLLASKMYDTAKSIVVNLITHIETYGHVLNGARRYYTNRSQPPLLSAMIHEIYKRTSDVSFLRRSIPALVTEYKFWNSDIHKVTIQDAHGHTHTLNRYYAKWNRPRPESATIDKKFASKLSTVAEKEAFYREVASAAESGWDFSTRWMRNPPDITTLRTTSILPVDLNVFILGMELDIASLAKVTGDKILVKQFSEASEKRKKAINSIFWNKESGQWHDYWLDSSSVCQDTPKWKASNQNKNVFASNFVPLWFETFHSDPVVVEKVMKSLKNSGLLGANGIATSTSRSGEQWDFPNGWAPLQHMIVEGLVRSSSKEAKNLAEDIAIRWIRTNHVAYRQTSVMHEKYDVEKCGEFGAGGEYVPQTGFGWSNGLVLTFLEEFGWPQGQKVEC